MHCARPRGVEISTYGFLFTKVKLYVEVCSAGVWQYRPKHVVVHLAIKYTYVTQLCLTIYNFQVSHTQRG